MLDFVRDKVEAKAKTMSKVFRQFDENKDGGAPALPQVHSASLFHSLHGAARASKCSDYGETNLLSHHRYILRRVPARSFASRC